jgi:hypothetical protein
MGLTISSVLTRLFGKKQMRILMGKFAWVIVSIEWQENKYEFCKNCYWHPGAMLVCDKLGLLCALYIEVCMYQQVRLRNKLQALCNFMVNGSSVLSPRVK